MKKSNKNSLDGFVPRRADDGLGEKRFQSKTSEKSHSSSHMSRKTDRMARPDLKASSTQTRKALGKTEKNHSINTKDISDSLRLIDEDSLNEPKSPQKNKVKSRSRWGRHDKKKSKKK